MPLKAGKKNIGANIREMEAHGHKHSQAVAAALRTAYDRANGGKVRAGALDGKTQGRADDLPIDVPNGSHVIPADVVAALGDGNTRAGFAVLEQMFPHSKRAKFKKGGKVSAPKGFGFGKSAAFGLASGGKAPTVGINASDGEFVVVPDDVAEKGRGDVDHGHNILDHFIVHTRKQYAHKLSKLPGPEK
jgi:hypothetical protein